jgi:hypothetical protein
MSAVTTCPAGPASSASSAALYPPEPISSTRMPGRTWACSSMTACMPGADTELVGIPAESVLVTTMSLA